RAAEAQCLPFWGAGHPAADNEHLLFASLANVTGPIITYGDLHTGPTGPTPQPGPHVPPYVPTALPDPLPAPDPASLAVLPEIAPPPSVLPVPPPSLDHVAPVPGA